jgi:DnaA family protein
MAQLPLELRLQRHTTLASFVAGANDLALEHVRAVAVGERAESVWLAGPAATGKTHLLAAGCRAASDRARRAMYLALDPDDDPGLLLDLDAVDLLALDDLHRVAGRPDWEAALFATFNARLDRGGMLLAAPFVPKDCGFALPDLASRAAAAAVYRLIGLDDAGLVTALSQQARLRGLELDDAAARYLLHRVGRDLAEMTAWLDRIDRFALVTQRRVTVPLLREVLSAGPRD